MDMCTLESHENFSEMRSKVIKCSHGNTVGHITDVVFDDKMNVHSFVVGGQLWDKFRQMLGFIHDVEHTFTADKINKIVKDEIRLLVSKNELKETIKEASVSSVTHSYTTLRRKVVVDYYREKIGKIVNMVFLPCGEAAFIVSSMNPESVGIPKGLGSKWDLLLPIHDIEKVTDKEIILNVGKNYLEKTLNEHIIDQDAAKKYLNSIKEKNVAQKRAIVRAYDGFHMK
jgi:sporulation protein YlmC with PRC-barrel domain